MIDLRKRHGRIATNERGSVAVQIGVMLIVILGFVALGTEIVYLLLKHREMQSAADGAAVSGATALMAGYPSDYRVEARGVASASGFANGVNGVTVTVRSPPTTGPNAGVTNAVEVIVSQPQTLSIVTLFRSGTFNVGARAVAVGASAYEYCMLALDPAASAALNVKNNAVLTNPKCGVAVNSNSATALLVSNNAAINGPTRVHGGWSLQVNAHLNGNPNVKNAPIITDPYASMTMQTPPACTGQSGSGSGTINLNPGHFCSGFNFSNGAVLNFAAGSYYVDTRFTLGNNVRVNATTGVTFIINGNYALSLGNGDTLRITAPTTGNYAGMAFFGSRTATPTVTQTFSNNTIMDIQGVIYFPNQIIEFDNNGTTGVSICTQVIGRIINVQNNVQLDNLCQGSGVKPLGGTTQLAE